MPDPSLPPDPKQGEREYYARIGEEGLAHALGKPFSDDACNVNLANVAALFQLLPPPPARLVEFGCGVGWLTLLLARRGYPVHGVDIAPEAIDAANAARDRAGLDHLTYALADYEEFDGGGTYDVAYFYDALHHAEDAALAVRCAARALKPGGMLIAFEPGDGHHDTPEAREVVAKFGVHENDMPARQIIALAEAAGFDRHLRLPFPWDTFRHIYRSSYAGATDSRELRGKYWLGLGRLIRRAIGRQDDHSIVVSWKPTN
ncbi:class I SAM-dependent methyltransferase [Synoicihabitans lomoniglobus]|uniref:Methyltransferase domain-containing protein n=1 Tax=Synoicihabitans lomoniglobus TaxID=2909285 RepID=A0AAF0CSY2_9BACT|nr:methyltransferase domain-containing protein [Opitutaceae bacterium LMO-M01]WED67492.1 methyltransferase domain-containing protein [Opitutaceae bacterium LMO-M01]